MAQAPKKKFDKLPTMVTPKGVASFPHLYKPDTEGKFPSGKYSIALKLEKSGRPDQDAVDAFVTKVEALHNTYLGKKKSDSPVKDGDDATYEGDHGFWIIKFKSKHKPDLRDTGKNPLPKAVLIQAGDKIRVAFTPFPYDEKIGSGISPQLGAVMLCEKRAGGNEADAFEEEEGYVADQDDFSDDSEGVDETDNGSGADY